MYCKNCSSPLAQGSAFCPVCGAPANAGENFCPNCGKGVNPGDNVCSQCGYMLRQNYGAAYQSQKSRLVAGLLGIFVGTLGIHNFYLGYTNKGITQILLSTIGGLLTCGIASFAVAIWAIIESIQIFTGSIATDANGVLLKD